MKHNCYNQYEKHIILVNKKTTNFEKISTFLKCEKYQNIDEVNIIKLSLKN